MSISRAAKLSAVLFMLLGAFQAALVAGVPWGAASWGGQQRGTLPTSLRIASGASLAVALLLAALVSGRLRVPFRRTLVLGALQVLFVVSVLMNAASPSSIERRIWVPYGLIQLAVIWVARRQEGTKG